MGISIGHNKVAKLKKELGLYPKMKRKYKITTDSNHNNRVFDNLLDRDFTTNTLTEKVVSDITYINTLESCLYLATLIDLSTRKLISYIMFDTMGSKMITNIIKFWI